MSKQIKNMRRTASLAPSKGKTVYSPNLTFSLLSQCVFEGSLCVCTCTCVFLCANSVSRLSWSGRCNTQLVGGVSGKAASYFAQGCVPSPGAMQGMAVTATEKHLDYLRTKSPSLLWASPWVPAANILMALQDPFLLAPGIAIMFPLAEMTPHRTIQMCHVAASAQQILLLQPTTCIWTFSSFLLEPPCCRKHKDHKDCFYLLDSSDK